MTDSTADAMLYARSFTDVYDAWYSDLDDPQPLIEAIKRRDTSGAYIVELGSGTGRLAQPLHRAGHTVIAVDIALDMLRLADHGPHPVAADMMRLPLRPHSVDVMIIAYNTLFNLASKQAQYRCFVEAARLLRPGGWLAIEAFVAPTDPTNTGSGFGVSVRDHPTTPGAQLAIITGPDEHDADVIVGAHIELGAETTCRPWRLTYQSPTQLDACAHSAGLALSERNADWSGTHFTPDDHRHVSWYEPI